MSYTLALIKPDAVKRNLVGQIITRIEHEGFFISGVAVMQPGRWDPAGFYARQHADKPYYGELVQFMSSGPTWALRLHNAEAWDGSEPADAAIKRWRAVMGGWNQEEHRDLTTIRGQLMQPGSRGMENLVHGSDSNESLFYELGNVGGLQGYMV